ncbi:Transcription regulator PadR N-terminal [Syntrophomonas zehnderi OL-4]|uniref:Transcription regulator PadR N-terminal n=1 Tax=Syntrophomonas zehnderi OL-4 TaxID=690567 RepID=A0A0E4GAN6_9FIRM|nr:PadR family transcriptional regulator [Syntrophomonas zehnderi]CFX39250.1 Transcription regulator PadR N-terminal [Syntrophomonas zehnderi OL-4]
MIKNMLSGFVRLHILHHASLEPIYGVEMIEELRRHGYRVGAGTVYPVLHQMEEDGLLISEKVNVEGRIRIYYQITEKGRQVLNESKKWLGELVKEVLEEDDRT